MKLFKEQFNIIIWMSSLRLGFHMEILQSFAFWQEVEMQVLSETNLEWNQTGDLIVFLDQFHALNFNEFFLIYPLNENQSESTHLPEMALPLEIPSAHLSEEYCTASSQKKKKSFKI